MWSSINCPLFLQSGLSMSCCHTCSAALTKSGEQPERDSFPTFSSSRAVRVSLMGCPGISAACSTATQPCGSVELCDCRPWHVCRVEATHQEIILYKPQCIGARELSMHGSFLLKRHRYHPHHCREGKRTKHVHARKSMCLLGTPCSHQSMSRMEGFCMTGGGPGCTPPFPSWFWRRRSRCTHQSYPHSPESRLHSSTPYRSVSTGSVCQGYGRTKTYSF